MARVKVINGKPVVFNKLPEVWQGINGHYLNFDKMSEDIWLENEFFEGIECIKSFNIIER